MEQKFLLVCIWATIASLGFLVFFLKHKKIRDLQDTDQQTGAYSRMGFNRIAQKVYDSHRRDDQTWMFLVYMDLDDFKLVNDTYGHDFGDKVLATFAEVVLKNIRKGDVFARLGGDEFVALLTHPKETKDFDMAQKMSSVRRQFEEAVIGLYLESGNEMNSDTSFSYGIVKHNVGENTDLRRLVQQADGALYKMKRRNRHK